ncbi:hypothetical protein FBU59_006095, partial [Linderina macrospora]
VPSILWMVPVPLVRLSYTPAWVFRMLCGTTWLTGCLALSPTTPRALLGMLDSTRLSSRLVRPSRGSLMLKVLPSALNSLSTGSFSMSLPFLWSTYRSASRSRVKMRMFRMPRMMSITITSRQRHGS